VHLLKNAGLDIPLRGLLQEFKQTNLLDKFDFFLHTFKPTRNISRKENESQGQLACKLEPAGKVRVFALVDVWTQSCLKPLHEMLFSFLRSLPNDGTFDQHASVLRCRAKADKAKLSFGYDLSAATDRLPLYLQIAVLKPIIGVQAAI
jgi:hypothetical protein